MDFAVSLGRRHQQSMNGMPVIVCPNCREGQRNLVSGLVMGISRVTHMSYRGY